MRVVETECNKAPGAIAIWLKSRKQAAAFYTLDNFPRLQRLRHAMLSAKKSICIERPKYLTEFFHKSGFDESKPVLRQAEALCYVLDHLSPTLFDDELIVGSTTSHRLGTPIYPEFMSHVLWPELPTIARRKFDPVAVLDEEADVLANEVFPFWKDHNIYEYTRRKHNTPKSQKLSALPENSWVDFVNDVVSCFPETSCGGRGDKFFDVEKPSTGSSSLFTPNREEEPVLGTSFHP